MDNSEIAKKFDLLAKIMELHDENTFRIKSYTIAYGVLRKVEQPFSEMTKEELEKIQGVGSTIADKIIELNQTGQMQSLEKYIQKTPEGIVEMLGIRGLGPKKVKQIWKELEIETVGELLYACNENRIANLKGFGKKTQEDLINILQYSESSKGKMLYAKAQQISNELLTLLKNNYPSNRFDIVGEISLQLPVISSLLIITNIETGKIEISELSFENGFVKAQFQNTVVEFVYVTDENYENEKFRLSCSPDFFEVAMSDHSNKNWNGRDHTSIHPGRRDDVNFLQKEKKIFPPLENQHMKGLIHLHTQYSDGLHSLVDMKKAATDYGFKYMVVTDHSKSAFYADGLKEDKVLQQWQEIDDLNQNNEGCYIFKGIESDILIDGALDYDDVFLNDFDCIIASVHSVLKMDVEKATKRLIKAIEHPKTKILGHPTGRLLLSRPGYPLHMEYVLDACLANGVAVELNANPRRLDVDLVFLPYIAEKEILLSINPDAHSKEAISHIQYGISIAQKANLNPEKVVNTWDLSIMREWLDIQ